MRARFAALLLALLPVLPAAGGEPVRVLERAEVLRLAAAEIPPDALAWEAVGLPHAWFRSEPFAPFGWAWYRIRFELPEVPAERQRIYLPRVATHNMLVYFNRELVWRLTDVASEGATLNAVLIAVPQRLLRPGMNVIHLRVQGSGPWLHGVSRVHFGAANVLARTAGLRDLIQGQMINAMAVSLGLAGLLTFALWAGQRRDAVLFWYGVTGVGLFCATLAWRLTIWEPDFGTWRTALVFLRFYGILTPLMVLHLRLVGRRQPWLEGALWAMLPVACASIGARHGWSAQAWLVWGLAYSVLPLLFLGMLLRARGAGPPVWLLALADIAAAALSLHDWAVRAGLLDADRPLLIFYMVPFVMLAAGAAIFWRQREAARALAQGSLELERRVAEKTREIQAGHARLRAAEQERALAAERRRIMADMHDGLGSRLVGLLSQAQSGRTAPAEMAAGIAAALDELRVSIDSLQPVDGDIGVVLGNVRHRMRAVFEAAGVRLNWQVGELPPSDDLTPARIFAIQRLLLEVFTNAIKHAQAATVSVRTEQGPAELRIVVEDDGRGYEVGAARNGHGTENLRLRAAQAGGRLTVISAAGEGTRVVLALPFAFERADNAGGSAAIT